MATLKLGTTTAITESGGALTIASSTLTTPTIASMANCTFPAGHILQVVYKQIVWAGDESADTTEQLWRASSTVGTLNMTLKTANARVAYSCWNGDCFSSSGCSVTTRMAARPGSSNLSTTNPESDSGYIGSEHHYYRLTGDDDRVLFVDGVMTLTNDADEAWCFAPTIDCTSGSLFVNYAGAGGRGSMTVMEIKS